MVFASRPVDSASRLAARPVGAQSSTRSDLARKISMMPRTMVVLPVPGPPVMTSSFCVTASRIASRWLLGEGDPHLPLGPPMAASTLTAGSGCGPPASA